MKKWGGSKMKWYAGVLCIVIILTTLAVACAAPAASPAPGGAGPTVTVTAPAKTVTTTVTATPQGTTAPDAGKTWTIRTTAENAQNYIPDGPFWTDFKTMVEARSNGRIKVQNYFNASLYNNNDAGPAVISGAVEMAATGGQHLGEKIFPSGQMFDMPSFFGMDANLVYRILTETSVGQAFTKEVESKGQLKVLGYFADGDAFIMYSNKGAISKPSDLKGLKMRASGGALHEDQLRLLGASPVTIPAGEAYMAVKQGVADGGETSLSWTAANKFYEVVKDITWTKHAHAYRIVFISAAVWKTLPADLQWIIQDAVHELAPIESATDKQVTLDAIKIIEDKMGKPIRLLTVAEAKAFQDALLPVENTYVQKWGMNQQALKTAKDFFNAHASWTITQ